LNYKKQSKLNRKKSENYKKRSNKWLNSKKKYQIN